MQLAYLPRQTAISLGSEKLSPCVGPVSNLGSASAAIDDREGDDWATSGRPSRCAREPIQLRHLFVSDTLYPMAVRRRVPPRRSLFWIIDMERGTEMFMLIEQADERRKAQAQLQAQLRRALQRTEVRNIGFPSGNVPDAKVHTDGDLWFHSRKSSPKDEGATPRTFNWFGQWGERSYPNLNITVEINISTHPGARIAGCFVVNRVTGIRYLAHSGAIGGGRKGVGQSEFLAWSGLQRFEVADSTGKRRQVVLVMPLDGVGVISSLRSFVKQVSDFKQAVREGVLDTPAFRKKVEELNDYYNEASGQRKGKRSSIIDYMSRHGDVVKALEQWNALRANAGTKSKKNVKIDLALEYQGQMTDLFEVKTARERAHIYTAIGQLITHARGNKCRKHMVLPHGGALDDDLADALERCQIALINYKIKKNGEIEILG